MANLSVTMSEEDWGKALNIMADAPFKTVAPLIHQMQRQLQMQMEQAQREQQMPTNRMNGAAEEVHAPGA